MIDHPPKEITPPRRPPGDQTEAYEVPPPWREVTKPSRISRRPKRGWSRKRR